MRHDRPFFATMEPVEKANHEQLARRYRFSPSGDTKEQQKIMDRIAERFKRLGGMTAALEKKTDSTCEPHQLPSREAIKPMHTRSEASGPVRSTSMFSS